MLFEKPPSPLLASPLLFPYNPKESAKDRDRHSQEDEKPDKISPARHGFAIPEAWRVGKVEVSSQKNALGFIFQLPNRRGDHGFAMLACK